MKKILIVGGGASGVLVAIHLARNSSVAQLVHIAEPREILGQGLAYSTKDESHLLNVPAGRMSIFPEEPDHFVNWIGRDGNYFATRKDYGRYLFQSFVELQVATNSCTFAHIKSRVERMTRRDNIWLVEFENGNFDEYEKIVLAMGHGEPLGLPALRGFRSNSRYSNDAWRDRIPFNPGLMVAIGTGLTFVDLALSHLRKDPQNQVIGISRNGLLPEPHLVKRAPAASVPASARTSPNAVRQFIDSAKDWRAAQDGVRHELPKIWHQWSDADKRDFFKNQLRWWNVHRHRIGPEIQQELTQAINSGRLKVIAGEVDSVVETPTHLEIAASTGDKLQATSLVNCLGYNAWGEQSLIGQLIESGYAKSGPLDLGICTNFPRFNVVSSNGVVYENLFAIGPILLGERFETTAIPELREQAREIALILSV